MKNLPLSYVILCFLTYATSSIANEQVPLVVALQKVSEQLDEIEKYSKVISREKDVLEESLLEAENLYDEIRLVLDATRIINQLQDVINEAQSKAAEICEDVYISVFEELVVAIGQNVTEPIQKHMHDLNVHLIELENDLKYVKQVVADELGKPETHSTICENNNGACKVIDELELHLKNDYNKAHELKNHLVSLIEDSLSYVKRGEIDSEIQNTVFTPVVECLKEHST